MAYLYSFAGSANNKGRTLHGDHLALKNAGTGPGELRIYEDSDLGSHFFTIKAGNLTATDEYTWPVADGDSGQQLQTDGSGALTWAAAGTATGAQTNITTIYNTSAKIGRDTQNLIDFATTDNKIIFRVNNVNDLELVENALEPVTNDGLALGTTSLGFSDLHLATGGVINWANGEMTITEGDANTLTVAGGTFATAALTTSTIVASGIVKTDDATDATSTTDGSLQTDGGLSVAKDGVVGNDLIMLSDAAVVHFGANKDVTLTHVADVGLTITHIGTGDNLPVVLQLKSEENAVVANEVIASLEFAAGDSDGTDGATVAAGIHAIAEGTFTASANATKLVFTTGVSETAASSATAKATLSSIGDFQVAGDLVVKDGGLVGAASALSAMTIASGGKVTFAAGFAVGSDSAGDVLYHNGTTYIRLAKGDDDQVLTLASGVPSWAASAGSVSGNTFATDLKVGRDAHNLIDFTTDDEVVFRVANVDEVELAANVMRPVTSDGAALGGASNMWSDLFIASGGVLNFNNGDMTLTHSSNTLTAAGGTVATAALTTSTIVASGIIKTDDTTAATSTTDGSLQTDGGLSVALDAVVGDDLILLSDSALIHFGAGKDVTLTHTNDTGLHLNAGMRLGFRDQGGEYIYSVADGTLGIVGATEIDLTATTIDINGALDVSGASQFSGAITVGVDDTGLDVKMFGATAGAYAEWDQASDLLELRGGAATPGKLLLSTAETTVVDGNKLGQIDFQAPLEGSGTDAILVGASIWAEADDTFAADNNETHLVFATAESATAAEVMRLDGDGTLKLTSQEGMFSGSAQQNNCYLEYSSSANGSDITAGELASGNFIAVNSAASTVTVNLPAASSNGGRRLIIKDSTGAAGTNAVTIDGNSSETIDGATTITLDSDYAAVTLICDGSNWHVV